MLRSGDVSWEPDYEATEKTAMDKSKRKSKRNCRSMKETPCKNDFGNSNLSKLQETTLPAEEKLTPTTNSVSLKDLNQEDKQKIAQLIKELAKVGEEKETIVHALNNERQKFLSHVRQLEDEKSVLMNKQQFLAEEVKQCQTLLQYYQNLITLQQASLMSQEEPQKSLHLDEMPARHHSDLSSTQLESGLTHQEELSSQPGDIKINEVDSDSPSTSDSVVTEDEVLRMSDHQYRDYLQLKKEKLKREQDSLRKLLNLKVQPGDRLDEIQISPVHGTSDQSYSSQTNMEMRSMPAQNLSPITGKENVSHSSLPRSFRNESHQKSCTSFRSSKTLKCSNSPEKILHLLSQDIGSDNVREPVSSQQYPSTQPLSGLTSNLSVSSSDASIATNVMSCEDSQILQDIFFV